MLLAIDFLKVFAGRKRPNFFALVPQQFARFRLTSGIVWLQRLSWSRPNWKLYRIFQSHNPWYSWIPRTLPCYWSMFSVLFPSNILQREILEAQFSFPSGHSGGIWCAMSFLSFYCLYVLHRYSSKNGVRISNTSCFMLISCRWPRVWLPSSSLEQQASSPQQDQEITGTTSMTLLLVVLLGTFDLAPQDAHIVLGLQLQDLHLCSTMMSQSLDCIIDQIKLSSSQRQLWFLTENHKLSFHHWPLMLRIQLTLDPDKRREFETQANKNVILL